LPPASRYSVGLGQGESQYTINNASCPHAPTMCNFQFRKLQFSQPGIRLFMVTITAKQSLTVSINPRAAGGRKTSRGRRAISKANFGFNMAITSCHLTPRNVSEPAQLNHRTWAVTQTVWTTSRPQPGPVFVIILRRWRRRWAASIRRLQTTQSEISRAALLPVELRPRNIIPVPPQAVIPRASAWAPSNLQTIPAFHAGKFTPCLTV